MESLKFCFKRNTEFSPQILVGCLLNDLNLFYVKIV